MVLGKQTAGENMSRVKTESISSVLYIPLNVNTFLPLKKASPGGLSFSLWSPLTVSGSTVHGHPNLQSFSVSQQTWRPSGPPLSHQHLPFHLHSSIFHSLSSLLWNLLQCPLLSVPGVPTPVVSCPTASNTMAPNPVASIATQFL